MTRFRISVLLGLLVFTIVMLPHYLTFGHESYHLSDNDDLVANGQLSFDGYSNSTQVLPTPITPAPVISNVDKQKIIDTAMNVSGIKIWSDKWHYVGMGFLGKVENNTTTWQYAVVYLHLNPIDQAASYCQYGWESVAKIDIMTKQVSNAVYPKTGYDNCISINIAGPNIIGPINNSAQPSVPQENLGSVSPLTQQGFNGYSIASQSDVAINTWYGNGADLNVPYYANQYPNDIFSHMNGSNNGLIAQVLNTMWNFSCGSYITCFTQAGWVILNYDFPSGQLTANTEDLVFVDQSSFDQSFDPHNTLISVTSGGTEETSITCGGTYEVITIFYNQQAFWWYTNIPCNNVSQYPDVSNNSVFFENHNVEPSADWSQYILSQVAANNAVEYDSNGIAYAWSLSSNMDGMGGFHSNSMVITGSLGLVGQATWPNLNFQPPRSVTCASTLPSSINATCTVTSSTNTNGNVEVSSGSVLGITNGAKLTFNSGTQYLKIDPNASILIEPGSKIAP